MVCTHYHTTALLIIELVPLNNGDLLEGTLAVNLQDVRLSFLHELFTNVGHVSLFGTISDLYRNQWILREDVFEDELLGQCNTLDILLCHVDELGFLVAANIIITNIGVGFAFDSQLVLLLRYTLRHKVVADTHNSFLDEVHVGDFMLLIQNELVVIVVVKLLWPQSKADIIQKFRVHVFSRVEESSELVDYVIEKVMKHDVLFNPNWTLVEVLIFLCEGLQSIVGPVVGKVSINLVDERLWKWLVRKTR